MCPKDYYANGFQGRFGSLYNQLNGFNGIRLRCATNTLSTIQFVQDEHSFPLSGTFSEGKSTSFISGIKLKYSQKERLWGFGATFEGMPVISNVRVTYNTVIEPVTIPSVIDSQGVINCASTTNTQTISFTKTYEITNTWNTQDSHTLGISISDTISVQSPKI